jgi:diguanylate cyclase (GGDEF)-like protein
MRWARSPNPILKNFCTQTDSPDPIILIPDQVKRLFYSNILVAVGYFLGGLAGLWLAIPPGNATVVWPAAGIALAAVCIAGPRILPGIFIGGQLIQTVIFLDTSDNGTMTVSVLASLVMTSAALLQAWLGARLVRGILDRDQALLRERSILLFSLLAAPLSCLISATISIITLWLFGVIAPADIVITWTRWWTGDTVGVLVFAPLVFCFFAEPRDLWKQRISSVGIPLCILVVVAFIAFRFSNHQEMQFVEKQFLENNNRFMEELKHKISSNIEATYELKEYFDTTNAVSAETFAAYTRPKLQRHGGIQALEWIPMVSTAERQAFEQNTGKPIRIKDSQGALVTAPDKPFYLPIHYVEPIAGNENTPGFDISYRPSVMEAVETACRTGRVSVTEPINLVQDDPGKVGIVFYAPVYQKGIPAVAQQDCRNLAGLVASVFRIGDELTQLRESMPDLGTSVAISNRGEVFYSNHRDIPNVLLESAGITLRQSYTFPVADQQWEMEFVPDAGFISLYSSWTIWLVLTGGLLIAAMAGAGLLMLTGRTLQTESLIAQRTRELNKEIREREHISGLLSIENRFMEMIVQEYSMQEILDAITKSIEESVPGSFASILLLEQGGKTLGHCSAPSLPAEYIKSIDGIEVGPDSGSCGTAAYTNRQIIVGDIEHDPVWSRFSSHLLKYGLQACWSTPITGANNRVLGTFTLYFSTVREPDPRVLDLIKRTAKICAITILRKQSEEKLTYHANHDSLTGLVNRHEFERRLQQLLETVNEGTDEHALFFMDLDQFKIVNDSCGHSAGDEMLRQLTAVLQTMVRKRDTLARLGGDEFGVLIEYCSLDDAFRVATSMQKAIQDYQFMWEGHVFRVGVSIGLVPINSRLITLTALMKDADAACYMAKELGRNRIHIYHNEDENLAKRSGEMQWIARLQRALDRDMFCLYAQTIEPLHGSDSGHYELLVRMVDEQGNIISPEMFLPAAERYNLISKLDMWVIGHVFRVLRENPAISDRIKMFSINLSGQSLTAPDILEFIVDQMADSRIENAKICFEITETAAISNMARAITFISTLKALGCRFALDDFGSGLSSFGYLKNLPVDFLKIDGMFVKNISTDPIDHAMVKSINEIGHVMGMKTIAEFVETDLIKGMLIEIGVDYAQGYAIATPRPLKDLVAIHGIHSSDCQTG